MLFLAGRTNYGTEGCSHDGNTEDDTGTGRPPFTKDPGAEEATRGGHSDRRSYVIAVTGVLQLSLAPVPDTYHKYRHQTRLR